MSINVGDKITVVRSPMVWTVTRVNGDGIRCRDCHRKVVTFQPADVLSIVERKVSFR
jgi:hypothetical protein